MKETTPTRSVVPPKDPEPKASAAVAQTDPHTELREAVTLVLECIKDVRNEGKASKEVAHANEYLRERIMNYLVMMRKRTLHEIYEFMSTPDGSYGWYWQGLRDGHQNWYGPFASRKLAIENRTGKVQSMGASKTPLDVIEKRILAELGVAT